MSHIKSYGKYLTRDGRAPMMTRNDLHILIAFGILISTAVYLASYEHIPSYDQMTDGQKISMLQTAAGMSPETYNFSVETATARLGYLGIYFGAHWLMIGLPLYIGCKIYDYVKRRKRDASHHEEVK